MRADGVVRLDPRRFATLGAAPGEVALLDAGPARSGVRATRRVLPDGVDEVIEVGQVEAGQGGTQVGTPQQPTGEKAASVELLAHGDVVAAVVRVVDIGRDDIGFPVVADEGLLDQETRVVLLEADGDRLEPTSALELPTGVVDVVLGADGVLLLAVATDGPVPAVLETDGGSRDLPLLAGAAARPVAADVEVTAEGPATTVLSVDLAAVDPWAAVTATTVDHPASDLVVDGGPVALLHRPGASERRLTPERETRPATLLLPGVGDEDGPVPAVRLDGPVTGPEHLLALADGFLVARETGQEELALDRLVVAEGQVRTSAQVAVPGGGVAALQRLDDDGGVVVTTAPLVPPAPGLVHVVTTDDDGLQVRGTVEGAEPLTGLVPVGEGRLLGAASTGDGGGVLTLVDVQDPAAPRLVAEERVAARPYLVDDPRAVQVSPGGRVLLPGSPRPLTVDAGPLLLVDTRGDALTVQDVPVDPDGLAQRVYRVGQTALLVGRGVETAPLESAGD